MSDEESKPFISTNRAVSWVCLDCGNKNYSDFQYVENQEERDQLIQKFGLSPGTEVSFMPPLVACVKCRAEFSTLEEEEISAPEILLNLAELLSNLNVEEYADDAMEELMKNHVQFESAIMWALECLEEAEPPESDSDVS